MPALGDLPALGDIAPKHIICGTCGVVTLVSVFFNTTTMETPPKNSVFTVCTQYRIRITRSALGASCRSEGRWARSRVRGKRVDGRVCSVTVAAVRLKEVWLCDPEGIRRPEPHPGVHLHAVKGKLSCIGLSIKYQFTAIVYRG